MNAAKRRMEIFNILQEQESVEISELASKFDVSTMTVRRDLLAFKKQGLVTMNYGGAILNKGTDLEPSFDLKASHLLDVKQNIAKEAAKYIDNGDTIILDCGTTTLQIAKYIQNKKVTILTNSWPVVNYLAGNPKIKIILAPGEYSSESAGVFSTVTIDFFKNYLVNKAFIGTYGCSLEHGVTVTEILDAEIKKALFQSAKERYLLVDSTKFEKKYFAKHADLKYFDYIITDSDAEQDYIHSLQNVCKKVIQC